jgi:hypothetical protein
MTDEQRAHAERLADVLLDEAVWHERISGFEASRRVAALLRTLAAEPERKPITIKQLRALPEWWPSFEGNPTLLGLVRAVERFHGIE